MPGSIMDQFNNPLCFSEGLVLKLRMFLKSLVSLSSSKSIFNMLDFNWCADCWLCQEVIYKATGLNLRSKRMYWAKHTNRHPGEKSHGANIRGKTDYSATIRFWRQFWSKVGTPSALLFGVHALGPQWHTTWYYEEPDQTCRSRPQGYSQPLHILLRLKCDPVLFFSSLSDSVWCREVS